MRKVLGLLGAAGLCLPTPTYAAAPAPGSVSPWVLLSAFGSPASSRELCREENRKEAQKTPATREKDERACGLPIPAGEAAATTQVYGGPASTLQAMPLIAGLLTFAGLTAYLLSADDGARRTDFPISPA